MYITKNFGIAVLTVPKVHPPPPQTMLTMMAPIKGVEINIVRGGGKDCIVKGMSNFARAFAKVSQDVWPGLY